MKLHLFVHGQFFRAVEVAAPKERLCVPCDVPVPIRFPLRPPDLLARTHHAEFHRLLATDNVWACVDPHIALVQGQLLYREVSQ